MVVRVPWMRSAVSLAVLARISPSFFSMASRPETESTLLSILVSLYILGQGTYKMQTGMFRWESLAIRSAVKLTGPFVMPFSSLSSSYSLLYFAAALLLNACHL
jgi:hypothetical protein